MAAKEIYQLTHPEILSESQLKEILEIRCIDFSDYEKKTRSELIELYKRVALPLPRRESKDDSKELKETNESNSLNGSPKTAKDSFEESFSDSTAASGAENSNQLTGRSSKSSLEDEDSQSKRLRLNTWNKNHKCNGLEKLDGAPLKKRQKITWP